jgi:hypothetical protein
MKGVLTRLVALVLFARVAGFGARGRRDVASGKTTLTRVAPNQGMSRVAVLTTGMGLGALIMYLFDVRRGNRRRALVRDQAAHLLNQAEDALGKSARDFGHRAAGLATEIQHALETEEVTDEVLEERVREALGRVVSFPRAIDVAAQSGRVTLSGPILRREVDDLLDRVRHVRGVSDVEDRLEVHDRTGEVPGLQGRPLFTGTQP